jgi:uncharacterized protein YneF (UPF0154 family)
MPSELLPNLLLSFLVGVGGAGITAYVSIKVMMAKFETWRDIRDGNIRDLMKDMATAKEDIYVHDVELATLYDVQKMPRLNRQRIRL